MSNMMSDAAAWLASQLQTHARSSVVYRRGAASVSLTMTKGQTQLNNIDLPAGFADSELWLDFLLPTADLILSGSATLPQRGDSIVETLGGHTYTHTVLPIAGGDCYHFCDPTRQQLRIHTKQTSIA